MAVRPLQNLSDEELSAGLAQQIQALQTAAILDMKNQLAAQSDAQTAKLQAVYQPPVITTSTTTGGVPYSEATQLAYNDTLLKYGPYIYGQDYGSFYGDEDRTIRRKIDRIFNKLHKQVERELALA